MKPYFIILVLLLSSSAAALRNPAAVYCDTLGYNYSVEETAGGGIGRCTLPNNVSVDAWSFLGGEVAQAYSYCALEGYEMRVVENATACMRFMTPSCAVCILPDGTEKEVTALMGLTFQESTCGDSVCGYPETYSSCPQDCPKKEECVACESAMSPQSYVIVGLALLAVAIIFMTLHKKKKK